MATDNTTPFRPPPVHRRLPPAVVPAGVFCWGWAMGAPVWKVMAEMEEGCRVSGVVLLAVPGWSFVWLDVPVETLLDPTRPRRGLWVPTEALTTAE